MSDKSNIAWTNSTWNPVTGCAKVSPGCKHCYAEREWPRFYGREEVAVQLTHGPIVDGRQITEIQGKRPFTHVVCHEDRLDIPLRWKRPRRIFVNSMSDLFHEKVPDAFIDRVFAVMALAPRHTFQILTKRPERMLRWFDPGRDNREHAVGEAMRALTQGKDPGLPDWPLPNVWIGVSVEDQGTANERIPLLLETPAAVRWVSAEPLLGPVDLDLAGCIDGCGWVTPVPCNNDKDLKCPKCRAIVTRCGFGRSHRGIMRRRPLDWVVVGGESGPYARPMHSEWARSILRQCRDARIPVFIKQLGAAYSDPKNGIVGHGLRVHPDGQALISLRLQHRAGADTSEWPEDLRVREFPEPPTTDPAIHDGVA